MNYELLLYVILPSFGLGALTQFIAFKIALKHRQRKENYRLFNRRMSFIEGMMEKWYANAKIEKNALIAFSIMNATRNLVME